MKKFRKVIYYRITVDFDGKPRTWIVSDKELSENLLRLCKLGLTVVISSCTIIKITNYEVE